MKHLYFLFHRLFLFCILLFSSIHLSVQLSAQNPALIDGWWEPMNGTVHSMAVDSIHNRIYLGGNFSELARPWHRDYAVFNRSTGEVDLSAPQIEGNIQVAEPDGMGGWYLGGTFTDYLSSGQDYIVHIDSNGLVYPALSDSGFSSSVYDLELMGDTLFIGGSFEAFGEFAQFGTSVDTNTSNIDLGFPQPNHWVYDAVPDGAGGFYIGGRFSQVGDSMRNGLAHIDSNLQVTAWNPNVTFNEFSLGVQHMELGDSVLYIAGSFTAVGGVSRNRLTSVRLSDGMPTSFNPNVTGINTMELVGDTLFIGGNFSSVSSFSRSRLAALNAHSGSVLSWNPSASSTVYDLEHVANSLYVCGAFTTLSSQTRNRLASFDLSTGNLSSWNPNSDGLVLAMVPYNGLMHIGGDFGTVGGQFRENIAALSLSTGIANSWNPGANDDVDKLSIQGGRLYVSGDFDIIDGAIRSQEASFDLSTGTVSMWRPFVSGQIEAIALSGGRLFVGNRGKIGGKVCGGLVAMNRQTGQQYDWNSNVFNGIVSAFTIDDSLIYLGGSFQNVGGLPRDGLACVTVDSAKVHGWESGHDGSIYDMEVFGNKLVVAGSFNVLGVAYYASNNLGTIALADSGFQWGSTLGAAGAVHDLLVHDGFLYAGGDYYAIDGTNQNAVCRFDSGLDIDNWYPDMYFSGLPQVKHMYAEADTLFIGGNFDEIGFNTYRYGLAGISTITEDVTNWQPNVTGTVTFMYPRNDGFHVSGNLDYVNVTDRANLAALDASSGELLDWAPLPVNGPIYGMAVHDTTLYIGGGFLVQFGNYLQRNRLAALSTNTAQPTAWEPDANGTVWDVEYHDGLVYAGGDFTTIGGQTRNRIAALDASINTNMTTAWNPNANGRVYDVMIDNGLAYLGGQFTSISSTTRNRAAAVQLILGNLQLWNPDANGDVRTIVKDDTSFYLAGDFSTISSTTRQRIAKVNGSTGAVLSWNPWTGSVNPGNWIGSLVKVDTLLYTGGNFFDIGFTTLDKLVSIKTTVSTSNLMTDWNPAPDDQVDCLLAYNGRLFVGGEFEDMGVSPRSRLAVFSTNNVPELSISGSLTACPGDTLSISVSINDESPSLASLSATSSNQAFVNDGNISISGSGNSRIILLPLASMSASTAVTITVTDPFGLQSSEVIQVSSVDVDNPLITVASPITAYVSGVQCTVQNPSLVSAQVSDNCVLDTVYNDAPASFPIGTTVVSWTAIDAAGNTTTVTQDVHVLDTIHPQITAPADILDTAINGQCAVTGLALGTASGSDNCSSIAITNDAPSSFPTGITLVTWTASDSSGNVAVDTQLVVIHDTDAPTITAPADTTLFATASQCNSASAVLNSASGFDLCGSVTITNDAPSLLPVGNTTVTWIATDEAGNSASAVQQVSVVDTFAPSIAAPLDLTTSIDPGQCTASISALGSPTASDNCTIDSIVNNAPSTFPIGATQVVWTVFAGGLSASDTQLVTILDNVAPTISAPSNLTVSADPGQCFATNPNLGNPVVNENCSVLSVENDAPAMLAIGVTTVTWTVTDLSGNTATATQVVTVSENVAPTITAPADVAVVADLNTCAATSVFLGSPLTADNCQVQSVTNNAPSTFPVGATTVVWTVTDASGNTAVDSHLVVVSDTQAPGIFAPANINHVLSSGTCAASGLSIGSAITADNCQLATTSNDAPSIFPIGTTVVTWTATDAAGNSATATQTVNITETTPPVISAPAALSVNVDAGACFATIGNLGTPNVFDDCSAPMVTNDAPTTFPIGNTMVTWTATDASGNSANALQTVTVTDNINPTITAPTSVTVSTDVGSCSATSVSLGTPATDDNCQVASVTNDAPATFPIGVNSVTWTVVDGSGNQSTAVQTVTVEDNENPVPSISSLPLVMGECSAGIASAPTATDNCAGTITGTTNDPLTYSAQGSYTVVWSFDDGNGNVITQNQTVEVQDTTAPVVTSCPVDTTLCEGETLTFGLPVGMDNCSAANVTQTSGLPSGSVFPLGVDTVVFEVMDDVGNVSTCAFTVTVNELPDVAVNVTSTLCAGDSSGVAVDSITGGAAPYLLDWGGVDPLNLPAGSYSLMVEDNNGCIAIESFDIDEPDELMLDVELFVVDTPSNGCATQAEALVSGGTAPYTFLWNDSLAQTTAVATNLCPGSYCVTVTDSNGCMADTCGVEVLVGLKDLADYSLELKIYPNPNNGHFTLEIEAEMVQESAVAVVTSPLGKVVSRIPITASKQTVELKNLSSGAYYIHVQSSGFAATRRIIIL